MRAAVDARLKAAANTRNRPFAELRREFLYQRLLARVFHGESHWVLKGGVGLLTRIPGARHSRDVDLMHLVADRAAAAAEMRSIGRMDLADHLRFEVARSIPLSVEDALRLKTEVYVGASRWESFDIDVSCERHFVAKIEPIQPTPVAEIAGMSPLPLFFLYPLVDQIADKVAAMYETHGSASSNRYRDLVDLVLLTGVEEMDATILLSALQARECNTRNPVKLPTAMISPGTAWKRGYPAEAARSAVPGNLQDLATALAYVATCLNPILDSSIGSGTWRPATRTWVPSI